jgi:hypothetical protein
MGAIIECLGCGYGHDNLWSCERARVARERAPFPVAVPAVSGAAVLPVENIAEKTGGPSESMDELRLRLAATEQKLAEMLGKRRSMERRKKARHRANVKVKCGR